MTGLTLTTAAVGVVGAPATEAAARIVPNAENRPEQPDRPAADSHRDEGKRKNENKRSKGIPVPCDADKLIAAITLANARGGAVLDLAKKCTYLLTANIDGAGLPAITTPITLNGGKHTTIKRAAAAEEFRIFTVNANGRLTLNHLTITGGRTSGGGAGGGILINGGGAAAVNDSKIIRNVAPNADAGGVANIGGDLEINNSLIGQNAATNIGGGVFSIGTLTVDKSRFDANTALTGGGITITGGDLRVTRSEMVNHHAAQGGGIFILSGVTGSIADTRFEGNTATIDGGSAIAGVPTQLTMSRVTIANNSAPSNQGLGALFLEGGSMLVKDSIIKNNTGINGGGIRNRGALTLLRTKVSGNQATGSGGGIYNESVGTLTLFSTKIVKNTAVADGGGIFNEAGGTVELNTATGTTVVKNRPNNCVNVTGCPG